MIRLSIRRPVAVTMIYAVVAVLGVAAWRNIPIELLPNTDLPQLTVEARWRGASPEVTEAFLTAPLEAAIQQLRGVERIRSRSNQVNGFGTATITVEFDRDTDMDFTRLELSERLIVLDEDLPAEASTPTVQLYVPEEFRDQTREFLSYTVTGPYTMEALRTHLDDVIKADLLQVEGVADVVSRGGRRRVLQIELDQNRIRSFGLDINRVRQQISGLEQVIEAGAVTEDAQRRVLAVRELVASPQEVREMIISSEGGRLIRLNDVAVIRDTFEEARAYYRIDGLPAVSFEIVKELGTNVVEVADRVKERVTALQSRHLPGMRLILDSDESEEVKKQLTNLRSRAIAAAMVIFVVLLVFLRSFRSAGIIFATIGFSILIAINVIYFAGFTLNLLTLMGLAMGFGLIVDNAIVVLENVYRRRNRGEESAAAAEKGAKEVVLPIMASTLTTLIVFIPFVYMQGELRVYYIPLATVVGISLLGSLLVAFSFIPALASRVLRVPMREMSSGGQRTSVQRRRPLYVRFYASTVGFTVRHPWVTIVLAGGMFYGSYSLFDKYVNRGVLWGGWWGGDSYIAIQIRQPLGAALQSTDELTRHFEDRLKEMPEIEQFTTQVRDLFAYIRVTFPDSLENTGIPEAIKEQLVAYSFQFGGPQVRVYGYGPSFYGGGSSPPNYRLQVLGYNYEMVREIALDLQSRLERFSRVRDVNINAGGNWWMGERVTEYAVQLDRPRLAMHQITARDVVNQVQASVGGRARTTTLRVGGDELLFDVKFAGFRTLNVLDLRELLLTGQGASSQGVRLGDVATIEPREVLNQIDRENQQYERAIRYEFRGPRKLGDRVRDAVVDATRLPDGYTIETSQEWSWGEDEQAQIYTVLAVSIALIFMVTAALFESLTLPLTVLLTVPMALIGVFLMFFYTGASFTREAYIGVIMMGGVVVNNAILLVDHINQLRRVHGQPLEKAVIEGTLERVRPILMTGTTTIFGLLPLVLFSESSDANIWNALAYALIGGLTSSTLLVLTVTPSLYNLFEKRAEKRRVRVQALATTASPA